MKAGFRINTKWREANKKKEKEKGKIHFYPQRQIKYQVLPDSDRLNI